MQVTLLLSALLVTKHNKEVHMENTVVWFEIPVIDLDRSMKFYSYVMGVEFHMQEDENSKMAFFPGEEGTAGGALVLSEGYVPTNTGTVIYLNGGADLSEQLGRVESAGGKITIPKMSIGENGFFAHFEDTEGNRVALHSMG